MLYVDVHYIILCRVAWDEKLPHRGIRLFHGICGLLYIENWETINAVVDTTVVSNK